VIFGDDFYNERGRAATAESAVENTPLYKTAEITAENAAPAKPARSTRYWSDTGEASTDN
jgi:hypothetical protein